jgi:hypothetical protein
MLSLTLLAKEARMYPTPDAPLARRLLAGGIAGILLASVVAVYTHSSPGWWPLAAFGLGPDMAFLLSLEPGLERGRMSPRAVPLYNLLHRPAMPALLAALVVVGGAPAALLAGSALWGFHIAFDRALGYGLRGTDGRQR